MASTHPLVSLVVAASKPSDRQIRGQEKGIWRAMSNELIQHHANLGLRRVAPDRTRQHAVKGSIKDRKIKTTIHVKSRLFAFQQTRFQQALDSLVQHFPVRFNTEVARAIEKMNKPIAAPQATAAMSRTFEDGYNPSRINIANCRRPAISKNCVGPPRKISLLILSAISCNLIRGPPFQISWWKFSVAGAPTRASAGLCACGPS